MRPDKFVDDYLLIGPDHRCPLIPFRDRCKVAGLNWREVLAEIRGRYGNGDKGGSPWMPCVRMTMPDGSRPRAYGGFAFRDLPPKLPPLVALIWPHLPYRGPANEFPLPLSMHQLAGACKSRRVAMIRRKEEIWIVRDIDGDFAMVEDLGRDRRYQRDRRKERWEAYLEEFPHPA